MKTKKVRGEEGKGQTGREGRCPASGENISPGGCVKVDYSGRKLPRGSTAKRRGGGGIRKGEGYEGIIGKSRLMTDLRIPLKKKPTLGGRKAKRRARKGRRKRLSRRKNSRNSETSCRGKIVGGGVSKGRRSKP